MAAIEDGYVKASDSIDTKGGIVYFKGKPVKDSKLGGYGKITVKEAFELSSNTAVTQIINRNYQSKPQQFIDRLKSFGFDNKTGIDMLGEEAPAIKDANSKDWSGISLPWIAYGYESGITPLQMLNFYNAVANNGKLMKPQLVKEIRYRGQIIEKMEPVVLKEAICKKETIDEVMPMLKGVVKKGTATNLINPYFEIAGKTGTTQLGISGSDKKQQKYQASFVGFFPAEKPKYSCIVVIFNPSENGYYGNIVAGPVFKEVADKLYATRLEMHVNERSYAQTKSLPAKSVSAKADDLKNIFRFMNISHEGDDVDEWAKAEKSNNNFKLQAKTLVNGRVPDVRGMGLRDALYMLENLGYRVQIKGKGIVVRQSVEPGSQAFKNQLIEIELS
jgi:cell division protein FtsI (penicillin-binding protein 3)